MCHIKLDGLYTIFILKYTDTLKCLTILNLKFEHFNMTAQYRCVKCSTGMTNTGDPYQNASHV